MCFLQIFQGKGNRLDGKTKGLEIADQSSGNGTAKRFVDKKNMKPKIALMACWEFFMLLLPSVDFFQN